MKLALFFFILPAFECLRLKKCCDIGEYLEIDLTCKPIQDQNSSLWIPQDSFIIQSSQSVTKISKDLVNRTVEKIYNSKVEVGFPGCDASSRDLAISWGIPDIENEFYLLYESGKSSVLLNYYRKTVFHNNVTLSFKKNFLPHTFCVDSGPDSIHLAIVCPCSEVTCIRKCCHENQVYDKDLQDCVGINNIFVDDEGDNYRDWRPQFIKSNPDAEVESEYFLLAGVLPPCRDERGVYVEIEKKNNMFQYLENGTIQVNSSSPTIILNREHCSDWSWDNSTRRLTNMVMQCFRKTVQEEIIDTQRPFLIPILVLSVLLLVASAMVLFLNLNPDVEGRKGSKYVMYHVFCLALAHLIGAWAYGFSLVPETPSCISAGYIMQFSFLAAFFWLNVMCLDMSWTFSGIRPPSGSQKDRDMRKFVFYSIYAWGGSSALTLITIIVDVSPSIDEDSLFKPNVGVIKCWFRDTGALWLYFYGPMAVLLLMNVFLFIYTTYRIIVLKRGTKALHQENSARHCGNAPSSKDKQRFVLYAKLFSLMGVTWLTEIISWAVGGPNYIWYFTDAINLLRSVFIFIIFCWKPRVWVAIKRRFPFVKRFESLLSKTCCSKFSPDQDEMKTISTSSTKTSGSQRVGNRELKSDA